MPRVPIVITILLALVTCVAELYVVRFGSLRLSESELIQAQIGILATFGALVSAAFVVYSYMQTNKAFVESQRPQLLVQVATKKVNESNEIFPATFINYKNITSNQFSDLTLSVEVVAENRSIDIGSLFKPRMVMIGYDERQRWFNTYNVLAERGLDIKAISTRGNEVLLKLEYSYTFGGMRNTVRCQDYKWDPHVEHWSIA